MSAPLAQRLHPYPLFARFEPLWRPVLSQLSLHHYEKDEDILHHGDAADGLWLVISGWVTLVRHTPDGKALIVGLCTEGDLFGEAALFPQANYPYTAQTLQAGTELLFIPAALMRQMLAEHPELSHYVMQILSGRLANAQLKLEQMSSLSAAQRLGCFLLRLCQTQLKGTRQIAMPVEKHVIAAYLGMKPETFSRSMQQLGPVGIHAKGPVVTVEEVSRLRDYVCQSCGESGMCGTEEALMSSVGQ